MCKVNGVHELFERHATEQAGHVALLSSGRSVEYGELNETANRVAHQLIARGATPDRPIGLLLPRGPEFVIAALAVLKAGCAYLPLDRAYPPDRLRTMVRTARPAHVLVSGDDIDRLPAGTPLLWYDDLSRDEGQPTHNPGLPGHPEMLACMFFTSGSTGVPKGVMVPHRGILRLVDDGVAGQYTEFGRDEVFLTHSALCFDAVTYELWGALAHGGTVVIGPPSVPSLGEFAGLLRRHRVTQVWLTAGLFHLLVDERPRALGLLRRILAGGDVVSAKRVRQLFDELPDTTLVNAYGPTECTTFALAKVLRSGDLTEQETIPIGKPVPRTTARILDERLCPVPDGEAGELYLGGAGLARGYAAEPALTASRFVPDPYGRDGARLYATGDRVRVVGDGDIDFLGRVDQQVKIRGVRVELAEVEEHLRQHPDVVDVVVLPTGGAAEERRLTTFVVLAADAAAPPDERDRRVDRIREWLQEQVPAQLVPGVWRTLPAFPLNTNGKIDRVALSENVDHGGGAGPALPAV